MLNEDFFDRYIAQIDNTDYRNAISDTRDRFADAVLDTFDWVSFKQCLIYGDVQSGKTSHVLGIIGESFNSGFRFALFLTSDNTRLVDQTFDRVLAAFPTASVCSANDERRFRISAQEVTQTQPVIVVLNKNKSVLSRWKEIFSTTEALHGKPLLIIDDEADAASLNAKINKGETTPINQTLSDIRELAPSCIYLQVTGTPQANLLQAKIDGWRPDFVLSFSPGAKYIGGRALFDAIPNPHVRGFGSGETTEQKELDRALVTFLITAASTNALGDQACNMLIHNSRNRQDHTVAESTVRDSVDALRRSLDADETVALIDTVWNEDLKPLCGLSESTDEVLALLHSFFNHHEVNTLIVNSDNKIAEENVLQNGYNVVIGGDSLGRGLTIPALQTVFYSRTTKTPQADTLWQHARMFGYDRRLGFVRLFMPGDVLKTFHEVHKGNEAIKRQLEANTDLDNINIDLDPKIRPTRKTVLNSDYLRILVGGVNYFATDPEVSNLSDLDEILDRFCPTDDEVIVPTSSLISILKFFKVDENDFAVSSYLGILEDRVNENRADNSWLALRRGRRVRQGTGSLLSENDRKFSDSITTSPVLTLYRIDQSLGWSSAPIWVPNMKLPEGSLYYRSVK